MVLRLCKGCLMAVTATTDRMTINEWSRRALEARLFVPGWLGQEYLASPNCVQIMAFDPHVGWAIIHNYYPWWSKLAVFVRHHLRRKGQGSRLANAALELFEGDHLRVGRGVPGSGEFFNSLIRQELFTMPAKRADITKLEKHGV